MLLFLMIVLLINNDSDSKSTANYFNGDRDTYNNFSFVVCLQAYGKNPEPIKFCTGSLINRNWVITAAHCLIHENVTVTYGNTMSRELEMTVNVLQQIQHPKHLTIYSKKYWTVTSDIGLVEVETISMIPLVKLSSVDYKEFTETPVVFAGYGFDWLQNPIDFVDLIKQIQVIDSTPLLIGQGETIKCNLKVTWHPSVCVNAKQNMRQIADSGGPLIHNATVIGIYSGSSGAQMVFTPVSLYLDWISQVILKNKKQQQLDSDKTLKDAIIHFKIEI